MAQGGSPALCHEAASPVSRSPSVIRASTIVLAGYSEVSTATTASKPLRAA